MNKIAAANEYIRQNARNVSCRPTYHFSPPIGWMNDPNGFCFFKGEYHLFYQYNPYDVVWANIHWGHAVSTDLVSWKHRAVVMACDTVYDISGCFSGSAVEKDNELYLMYTGHIDPNSGYDQIKEQVMQQQCLAKYQSDGTVEKYGANPVINAGMLPDNYQRCDFRDPKVYIKDGEYYCVLAVRNEDDRGSVVLFKSPDLFEWSFVADIYRRPVSENTMFECPDLFRVDGKDVLVISIMPCTKEYADTVVNKVEYIIGEMNYHTGRFEEESRGLLDYGTNYYAPQTTQDKDGNRILIGWICEWSNRNDKYVKEYGYNGIMTIPRRLNIISGELVQTALSAIVKYEKEIYTAKELKIEGNYVFEKTLPCQHLHLHISDFETAFALNVLVNKPKAISFFFDPLASSINVFSNYTITSDKKVNFDFKQNLSLDLFMDNNCVELYVNGKVFTMLCYDFDKGQEISLSSRESLQINLLRQMEITKVISEQPEACLS